MKYALCHTAIVEFTSIMSSSEDMELLALENMINSSEAMFDRRRRILHEARAIIGDKGLDNLNMRYLSERADVSTKTIYNAFGSKETVVALAIYTYYESFIAHLEFDNDATCLAGALERQATSTMRDLDVPNYMNAVISLYFSSTIHPAIRTVLIDLATRFWVDWLRRIEDEREIRDGVVLRELLIDLSSLQYNCILEWCRGSVSEEVFLRRSISGVLILLIGATHGKARQELELNFRNLQSDVKFRENLFQNARNRIELAMSKRKGKRRARKTVNSNAVI